MQYVICLTSDNRDVKFTNFNTYSNVHIMWKQDDDLNVN